ncbi:MAG: SUF system Fe-S cluster assembly protein [Caldithrix sp. RBG_13_44_9]|nr:MAG: SUF system Fe-S cluster assembly protein [Caldithrix sp. RBG_13_44_9]
MKNSTNKKELENKIIEAIKTCYDPEIPVNIYEMGLIYDIQIDNNHLVQIKMTLTSPGCPVAGTLPGEIQEKVKSIEGISNAKVEVVWDPPWNPDMMSEEAKLELGFM